VVEPERVWANGLLVAVYVVTLALGALFFVATHHLAGGRWPVAFRRIPEALAGPLPLALLGLLVCLGLGTSHYAFHAHGAEHAAGHASTFWFKEWWLHPGFLIGRSVVYAGCWLAFATGLWSVSRRQDADATAGPVESATRLSAAFCVVFALTFSLASFDWLMALRPEWFSTIFAVYNFAGAFSAALAAIVIAAVWARARGAMPGAFNTDHLHDLSKLLLGFTSFWAYIWFSQYMLIWYSNIPEETLWYLPQTHGAWQPIFIANVVLNWAIPFFALLPKACKRSPAVVVKVAVVVLLGRWLDLYLVIAAAGVQSRPVLGVWEVAIAAGGVGFVIWAFLQAFGRAATVPLRDPYLSASLHHHTA